MEPSAKRARLPRVAAAAAPHTEASAAAYDSESSAEEKAAQTGTPLNPLELTVKELREELRLRALPHSGNKESLVERLQQLIQASPDGVLERMQAAFAAESGHERPQVVNRKEPARAEYASDGDFSRAWSTWREARDSNNDSVKKSREASRAKKTEQLHLIATYDEENAALTREVADLRESVVFMTQILAKDPALVSSDERKRAEAYLAAGAEHS